MLKILKTSGIIFISSLLVSGCSFYDQIVRPVPYGMEQMPEGTPVFQAGWKDGCTTGLTVYGNDRYKASYDGFVQDKKMILNDEYYRAWKEAYTYCRWYTYNWVRDARQ